MADIRAFRGLRYDLGRVGDPASLLAPPYDVIDDAGRAALVGKSRHNCVSVILPSGDGDARYADGAKRFRALQDEALVHDQAPSFYIYHQRFESEGVSYTRKGFICLVELTRFGQGPVLPHERTLSGPKEDRLKLMRACEAHLELVFGLFSDPQRRWEAVVSDHLGQAVLECDFDDVHHALHRVSDPAAVAALSALLADKNIYIADGHHRYETMCNFREELERAGNPNASHGMIFLSNLDDPGLVVLPTHRIVHSLAGLELGTVLDRARAWFDVEEEALPTNVPQLRARLQQAGGERAAFGLSVPGSGTMQVLTLRADYDPTSVGLGDAPAALQRLDVALLHELVLERGLGITKKAQAAKTNLRYFKSSPAALRLASEGDVGVQLVCFMNATPVADVVAVCDSGEVMPQKSTFFFPKIPTGLVFHDLRAVGG